jgi:hypothetical protein
MVPGSQRLVGDYANEIQSKYGKEARRAFFEELKKWDKGATTLTFYDVNVLEKCMQYGLQKLAAA